MGSVGGLLGCLLALSVSVSGVINLGVGGFYVVGALVAAEMHVGNIRDDILVCIVALLIGSIGGLLQDRLSVRPIENRAPWSRLLATMGVAAIASGVTIVIWGSQPFAIPALFSGHIRLFGAFQVHANSAALVFLALGFTFSAHVWLHKSLSGRVVAAMAEDREATAMLGANVWRIRAIVFAIVGAVASFLGVIATGTTLSSPTDALPLSLEGFIAAYLLGNGSSPMLALGGGLTIGLVDVISSRVFSSNIAQLIVAVLFVGVLIARKNQLTRFAEASI